MIQLKCQFKPSNFNVYMFFYNWSQQHIKREGERECEWDRESQVKNKVIYKGALLTKGK